MDALKIGEAFEAAVVEECAAQVRRGRQMTQELMIEAMTVVIRRQYVLLDRPEALRVMCDLVHARLVKNAQPAKKRLIDQVVIDGAPAEARALLERFRNG